MISSKDMMAVGVALVCLATLTATLTAQARSIITSAADTSDASVSAVIPSPNQDFGDEYAQADLLRTSGLAGASAAPRPTTATMRFPMGAASEEPQASNEASVPVYVSPFNRAERGATPLASVAPLSAATAFDHQESSHAPPNYAPRPAASSAQTAASSNQDLKTSASYGHGHHGYGYGPSGWLDMGAWTGGKGSFGWYADYPVGGGKHHGYGRK